jgi:hypothetical protein
MKRKTAREAIASRAEYLWRSLGFFEPFSGEFCTLTSLKLDRYRERMRPLRGPVLAESNIHYAERPSTITPDQSPNLRWTRAYVPGNHIVK